MGKIKLNDIATSDFFHTGRINTIHRALILDVLGRNTKGAVVPDQNLGTPAYQWLNSRSKYLYRNNTLISATALIADENALLSGPVRTRSKQGNFIDPAGASGGASCTLNFASTNLSFKVNDDSYLADSDLTISSLTLAPSSNNTCLVNDPSSNLTFPTRTFGEPKGELEYIPVDNMGSEITGKVGTFQSFHVNDGSNDEYFVAYVESATKLSRGFRGFYYDSSGNPFDRVDLDDGDTISLMSTAWIFLENNGTTTDTTYTCPVWGGDEPASPALDDYWYDTANKTWKRYNGSAFVVINRTLIGMVCMDTADCIGARCEPYYADWSRENTARVQKQSGTIIEAIHRKDFVNLTGDDLKRNFSALEWDSASHIAAATDTYDTSLSGTGTVWWVYLSKDGLKKLSTFEPYWWPDRGSWYHPHHTWRCLGYTELESGAFDAAASLPGVEDELYADGFQSKDAVNTISSGMGSWNTLIIFSSDIYNKDDIIRRVSTTEFNFLRPGYYFISFSSRMYPQNSSSTATDTMLFQMIDTGNGNDVFTFPRATLWRSDLTPWASTYMHINSHRLVKIINSEDDYVFQAKTLNGNITACTFWYVNFLVTRKQ